MNFLLFLHFITKNSWKCLSNKIKTIIFVFRKIISNILYIKNKWK
jgi:hypothetical protein